MSSPNNPKKSKFKLSRRKDSLRTHRRKQRRLGQDEERPLEESVASPSEPERPHVARRGIRARCNEIHFLPKWLRLPKRYIVAVLTCLGFVISFGMRCHVKVYKSAMKNNTDSDGHVKFNWTTSTTVIMDTPFFWGYLVSQVPFSLFATTFPPHAIFGMAVAATSILHILTPRGMDYYRDGNEVAEIFKGIFEAIIYPACQGIWIYWAPPLERSTMSSIAFGGSFLAIVLGIPLSTLLSNWFSWEAPFYFYGTCGLIWWFFWLRLVFERPSGDPNISEEELHYIEDSLSQDLNAQPIPVFAKIPLKGILTSMPFYAILVANFCHTWNFYLLAKYQGRFMREIFNSSSSQINGLGIIPHLPLAIIVPIGGFLADYLRRKKVMSTTNVRKLMTCFGFGIQAIFFLMTAFAAIANNKHLAMTAIVIGGLFSGFSISGFYVNYLDIAPRYVSMLMSMSNTIATMALLGLSSFVDSITKDKDAHGWSLVFITAACVHDLGLLFYGKFCSGKSQRWAMRSDRLRRPNSRSRELIVRSRPSRNRSSTDVDETRV